MIFDLEKRTAALSVGEFAGFYLGPREAGAGGAAGLWRAQLGTHWHNELRSRAIAEHAAAAEFEIPISGQVFHRGWLLTLTGRIDQIIRRDDRVTLREIKSVTRPLPADESELRSEYPEYFVQIASYAALAQSSAPLTTAPGPLPRGELVFVETGSGLAQTVALTPADDALFRTQLERFVEFLTLRLRARERLRGLRYRPAFPSPRPGQETTRAELTALFERQPLVLFEAPTGFGKTGVLLEFALGQLRSGHFDRVLYLTSKATGQLQVVRTLSGMTASPRAGEVESHRVKGEDSSDSAGPRISNLKSQISTAPATANPESVVVRFAPLHVTGGRRSVAAGPDATLTEQRPPPKRTTTPACVADTSSVAGGENGSPDCHSSDDRSIATGTTPVAAWHVRNKGEHCVNTTFHCVRDRCLYLADAASRWPRSGLARFYLDEKHARDLDTLRAAGRDARICPYEITRTALAFNDVWIGDYNYVFAPRNRGLFFDQPGFVPARTLLLIDEAHNLPTRVADAYSHGFTAPAAYAVRDELHRLHAPAPLVTAWDHWCHFLHTLRACDALTAGEEDDARHLLGELAKPVRVTSLDFAALGPEVSDALWKIPSLVDELETSTLPRLWWSPRDGELLLTCLDAAAAIGATLREFGGVVLASATLTPVDGFAAACGVAETGYRKPETGKSQAAPISALSASRSPVSGIRFPVSDVPARLGTLNKRDTRKLYRQLTSAAELLRVEEARDAANPALLRAHAPWREASYDIAFDARVDTTFQHRTLHYTTTAATIAGLQSVAAGSIAVFFPSYAYAEAIAREMANIAPAARVASQPKLRDLAAQSAWVEEALLLGESLFLVLGSSFAESIDVLGGRVSHAMVVGPALPEVNAVQRARLAEATRGGASRDEAFRRVYQIPGMTKVNQALGRLVRAPGHRARVVLHCRRFLEPTYSSLLAPEYQAGTQVHNDAQFDAWLRPQ